jgi:hypothetical protein
MFKHALDPIEIAILGFGIIAGLALIFVNFQRLVALAV